MNHEQRNEIERIIDDELAQLEALLAGGASREAAASARMSAILEDYLDEVYREAGVGRRERRRIIRKALKDPRLVALLPPGVRLDESS